MAIYFEIQVNDTGRARRFYAEVFGWKFSEVKGLPVAYWTIDTGTPPGGGLLQRPVKAPPTAGGTNAFVCSFEVGNFDAIGTKVLNMGGMVAMTKFEYQASAGKGIFWIPREILSAFFNRFNLEWKGHISCAGK